MRTKHLFLLLICLLSVPSFSHRVPVAPPSVIVYIFLSETCPICQSYTLPLKELYTQYNDKGFKFVGIFPNYYSNAQSLSDFREKYSIPFELILDKNGTLSKRLGAGITPE